MSSPSWSVYEGGWGDSCQEEDNLPVELSLRGCGLRRKCLLQRGAQGAVYLAEDESGSLFAVKRLFTQHSDFGFRGISESAIREATLLSVIAGHTANLEFNDDFGVVRLHKVVEAPYQELCLILEMYPLDLSRLVIGTKRRRAHSTRLLHSKSTERCPILAQMNVIQYLMRGILGILQCLHESCRIIHRDVKPSNFLVGDNGQLRLTDFGSARVIRDAVEVSLETGTSHGSGEYTPVALRTTVIYEAPECLLGERAYTPAVDVWAAGVVFAELLLQQHLFSSKSELAMLSDIWKLLGTPPEDPSSTLSSKTGAGAVTYAVRTEPTVSLKFPETIVSLDGLDLLKQMLELDPTKRITASAALRHPFLSGPKVEQCREEAKLLWRKKVQACVQEAMVPISVGMQPLHMCDEDEDEDYDYYDEGNEEEEGWGNGYSDDNNGRNCGL